MRAAVIHGSGDVRIDNVPDPKIRDATDVIVRVLCSAICGGDLPRYLSMPTEQAGGRMGHEFIGTVEDVGTDVVRLKPGDLVISPSTWCDNTCEFCAEGLHTSCSRGGVWGYGDADGAQGEAFRVPFADGTLIKLPVPVDSALLPSLLTLADVFSTGHHCALVAGVTRDTSVTVIGDGAVGLCAVLEAKRLGAQKIILMGRHRDRTDLGRTFGADWVIPERGVAGVTRVRDIVVSGTDTVLECVGTKRALATAIGVARAGGTVSRVGMPQYSEGPIGEDLWFRNIALVGGVAPARAYIEELMPDILDGTVDPGRVFDSTITLDEVPAGYSEMASRQVLKAFVRL